MQNIDVAYILREHSNRIFMSSHRVPFWQAMNQNFLTVKTWKK